MPVHAGILNLPNIFISSPVTNGQSATWAEGENTLTIVVTNGELTKTYTVTVTKS